MKKTFCILTILLLLPACGTGQKNEISAREAHKVNEIKEAPSTLQEAVKAGDIDRIKGLIAAGADVNSWTHYGTPLGLAVREGHKNIVEFLVSRGADIDSRQDYHGHTPLHLAFKWDHTEIAEFLIDRGANVNARDRGGKTPLHYAVETVNQKRRVIELLIKKGADVNAKDAKGKTPIDYAHKWEIQKLLRNHGGVYSKELNQSEEK